MALRGLGVPCLDDIDATDLTHQVVLDADEDSDQLAGNAHAWEVWADDTATGTHVARFEVVNNIASWWSQAPTWNLGSATYTIDNIYTAIGDTQIPYSVSGVLTGDAGLTYDAANDRLIVTQAVAGTGGVRVVNGANIVRLGLGSAGRGQLRTTTTIDLDLGTNATSRWRIGGSTGHLLGVTDNSFDIGASGATRPRTLYLGTSLITPSATVSGLTATHVLYAGVGGLVSGSAGLVWNNTNTQLTIGTNGRYSQGAHGLTVDADDWAVGSSGMNNAQWDNSANLFVIAQGAINVGNTNASWQARGDLYLNDGSGRSMSWDASTGALDLASGWFAIGAAGALAAGDIYATDGTNVLWWDASTKRLAVGTNVFSSGINATTTSAVDGSIRHNMACFDETAMGVGVGGGIIFGGQYTSGGAAASWAGISSYKTTGVSGDFGGELHLSTRPNGGVNTARIRIMSDGNVRMPISATIGADAAPTNSATLDVQGSLGVGTHGWTLATADFAVGSSTSSRLVWDDNTLTLLQYGTGAAIFNRLSSVAGTETTFNEQGADINHRFGGTGLSSLLQIDAGADQVNIGATATSGDRLLYLQRQWSETTGARYGQYGLIFSGNSANSTQILIGYRWQAEHRTAFNHGEVRAGQFNYGTTAGFSTGTCTGVVGLDLYGNNAGAGTVTTSYDIRINAPSITGPATTWTQLHIADIGTGPSTKIGIRQVGTNAHNRLNGNTMIGADSAPSTALHVTGATTGTTYLNYGGATAAVATGDAAFGSTGTYWFLDESADTILFETDSGGAIGPIWRTYHNSASPAAADTVFTSRHDGEDDAGATVTYGEYRITLDNPAAAALLSHWEFDTWDAGVAKTATLSAAGAWTDASSAGGKTYLARWRWPAGSAVETIRALNLGVYHSRNNPTGDLHVSPTAENWRDVTGLRGTRTGLAAKDMAGLALFGVRELAARVDELEREVARLRAA